MALADIFREQAPSFYLGDVADLALEALADKPAPAYPWHWQDLVDISGRSMVDLRPIDFYDEYLSKRVEVAVQGEGIVGMKPHELRMPPGTKGVLVKRDGWAVRLILDYSISRDSQVLKVDLARVE